MNLLELELLAKEQKDHAKMVLADLTNRGGYLNPDLPVCKFVDAMMAAVVLEMELRQAKAASATKKEPNEQYTGAAKFGTNAADGF